MFSFIGTPPPTQALNLNNGVLTASAPVLTLGQTWNNASAHFAGLAVDYVNTASGASSTVFDFRVSGVSVAACYKSGQLVLASGTAASPAYSFLNAPSTGFYYAGTNDVRFSIAGVTRWAWWDDKCSPAGRVGAPFWSPSEFRLDQTNPISWASSPNSSSKDTGLVRHGVGLLRVTNGSTGFGSLTALAYLDQYGVQLLGDQQPAVADVASTEPAACVEADATDLASALLLVNELKANFAAAVTIISELKGQLNSALAADRAHGLIAP